MLHCETPAIGGMSYKSSVWHFARVLTFDFQGKKKRLRSINDIMQLAIERHKRTNLMNTLYATCAVPRVGDYACLEPWESYVPDPFLCTIATRHSGVHGNIAQGSIHFHYQATTTSVSSWILGILSQLWSDSRRWELATINGFYQLWLIFQLCYQVFEKWWWCVKEKWFAFHIFYVDSRWGWITSNTVQFIW